MDKILELVRKWDEEELLGFRATDCHPTTSSYWRPYYKTYEYIKALEKFRFVPYLNDEIQDFSSKLDKWLKQFDSEDEKQLALTIVSNITFITEEQIRYLQEVCYQEKLRFRLLDQIIVERGLDAYGYDTAMKYYNSKLEQCLFAPLTDSARLNQFFHVNDLENHSRFGLRSLDIFVHPEIINNAEIIKSINERHKDKPILVVLEDFCGSGKTFSSDLARLAKFFPCFKTIFFCPYIITEWAEKALYRVARKWASNLQFEILYGMRISNSMRCFSPSSILFSKERQDPVKALCRKYHARYFGKHRFIGQPRSYPFGYRNLQLLVVMQSNCPNHTLPIIWCADNGWFPLFRRIQRYA